MIMKQLTSYNHTIYASYIGYITQAIVNNFAGQLFVDLVSARIVDRIGYRVCIVAAHIFAAAGIIGMATFPLLFSDTYVGIFLVKNSKKRLTYKTKCATSLAV